jgi:hypothetical protein
MLGILSLGLLAGVALTASPAPAAEGPGPYLAEPAWDRKMGPVARFLVLTDWNREAVLDKETGLVWERVATDATALTWRAATFTCLNKAVGGRKGWRLPSMPELSSLLVPSAVPPGPALLPGHPFQIALSNVHWSATTDHANPSVKVWAVNVNDGNVFIGDKAGTALVWCVRGGMNAAAYD